MRRRLSTALAACLTACALAAPAGADVSGPDVVAFLNAQRAANGIPAGIVEDLALSAGCAAHDNYGALNHVLIHDETVGNPGYSDAGKQAAQTSVLYSGGGPWTANTNPFETAPIHLHQLLSPRLDRMGAAETQGYGCATTLASRSRPAPGANVTYTYPGDGAAGWFISQVAAEGPYTPGQQVGIPAGTRTGPYLYVSFDGPTLNPFASAHSTGATLTGPDGPVPVSVADNTTAGLANYLPTGMEVIPSSPLKTKSTYTATVSADVTPFGGGAAIPFTKTWSFTTGGQDNATAIYQLTAAANGDLAVWLGSTAPSAAVTATGPGTAVSATVAVAGNSARTTLHLDRRGTWRVCVRSGGIGTDWQAAERCQDVVAGIDPPAVVVVTPPATVVTPPAVIAPPPSVKAPVVAPAPLAAFPARVKARLSGRSLTVPVRCAAACSLRATATLTAGTRKVKLARFSAKHAKAGTFTVRFTLSKATAKRLRAAHTRRLALTVMATPAKGKAMTLRRTLSI
jgi:hypothetical protein